MRKLTSLILMIACACTSASKDQDYAGHGSSTVEKKVVGAFAPPPLPAQISSYVQGLLEITEPGLGALTPKGDTMFFTWGISGTRQVWKLDGPMKFPVQLTSGNDPVSIFEVTLDGKYVVLTRDRAGEESPGLYLLPAGGGPLIEVQHKKNVRTRPVWTSMDGTLLYYLANDIQSDSYALYSYEIPTGKKTLLFSQPGLWFVADVRGDSQFLLGKMTGARTREYFTYSLKENTLEPVLGQNEKEEYEASFGYNYDTYIVSTPKFGEFRRLYSFREGKFTPITPDVKKDVESFSIDHRHLHIYVQYNDNGYSKLEVRDAQTPGYPVRAFPEVKGAEQVFAGNTSRFGRYVGLRVETGLSPGTNYVYDWGNKTLTQWSRPSAPEIDMSKFQRAVVETYPAHDGTKIPMLVTRPRECASEPCPVVVHFHGGPESQSRPGFNRLAQIFAGAGFIFVEPNVRGSEGYGKAYRMADDGVKRLDVISDIEDCAKFIRAAWGNPRLGVIGGSYGGYSVLMAMTKFAGSYDAGVSIVGMSHLRTFLKNTAAYRTILRTSEYGDPDKDADALEKLSPLNYVKQLRDPLMIIQGVSDPRVPVGEALQMRAALEKRGVKAPLILLQDEGHSAVKRDNRVIQYGHALKFMQEELLKPRPKS